MNTIIKSFTVLKEEYEYIGNFREGLAFVRNNFEEKKVGFIDKTGKVVIPLKYYDGFEYEGIDNGKWMLVPPGFSEGLVDLRKPNGKCGFVDAINAEVIPFEYDNTYFFSEGAAAVQKGGKWGFIDKANNTIIPLEYDFAYFFSEGLATVQKGGKWGFIDKANNTVIPLEYDFAHFFHNGIAEVKKDGEIVYIDKTGKIVNMPQESENTPQEAEKNPFAEDYDEVGKFHKNFAIVRKGGDKFAVGSKYGYIDKTGNLVVPMEYDHASVFSENLAVVKKDGKWGILQIETED